ncbi:MAG: hydrogenase maturation protease [Verrucomicrobiota bacterium]
MSAAAEGKILVAGIGNIFFGDDAFGGEVARELQRRPWPDGVRVEDFGIRGYDLAYALMDGTDAVLIDAVPRGEPPGTLYLIEPDLDHVAIDGDPGPPDGHTMTPASVLRLVQSLGGRAGRIVLVGCEPAVLEADELGLSAPVRAAVPGAVALVARLVDDLLHDRDPAPLSGAAKEVS